VLGGVGGRRAWESNPHVTSVQYHATRVEVATRLSQHASRSVLGAFTPALRHTEIDINSFHRVAIW